MNANNDTRQQLDRFLATVMKRFVPRERLDPLPWAEKFRVLSSEDSDEKGPFRASRTPYTDEIYVALADDDVKKVVWSAGAQSGKTTVLTNYIGYTIHQRPRGILYIQPADKDALDFSMGRIDPMIRDTPCLRRLVREAKSRDSRNTRRRKMFPGGTIKFVGTNVPNDLASVPMPVIIYDEGDRGSEDVGGNGSPSKLAEARAITFSAPKIIYTSTPTIKGDSFIEKEFHKGTMERYKKLCPNCGTWHEIIWEDIHYQAAEVEVGGTKQFIMQDVVWHCPTCTKRDGAVFTEAEMKRQPGRWEAENPTALARGIRSFWSNSFISPWVTWDKIVLEWLEAQGNPNDLKTVFNNYLGKLWENRTKDIEEAGLLGRREGYGMLEDETAPADMPNGALLLTCAVDVQKDRLEYEVVAWGHWEESWGVQYGVIPFAPGDPLAWKQIDELLDHEFHRQDGKALRIAAMGIDSGFATDKIYARVYERKYRNVYALKGESKKGMDLIKPKKEWKKIEYNGSVCYVPFKMIYVDAGKEALMYRLKIQQAGPGYCHFPERSGAGYNAQYFHGLLSEEYVQRQTKTGRRTGWFPIPGHERNEPLDCRNYNQALVRMLHPDFQAIERELEGQAQKKPQKVGPPAAPAVRPGSKPIPRNQVHKDAW